MDSVSERPRKDCLLGQLPEELREDILRSIQEILPEEKTIPCDQRTVYGAAFSPNNRSIATCGENGTVRIWDVKTAREATRPSFFRRLSDPVLSVAFSPDGNTVASASGDTIGTRANDNTVRLWDVVSGAEKCAMEGHSEAVTSVAWNHDGSLLASGSYDKTVKLWDPKTQELKCTLTGHTGPVLCAAFSLDGRRIASAGGYQDNTVRIWDVGTGKEATGPLMGHSRDNPECTCTHDRGFEGNYEAKPECPVRGHSAVVRCVAFSPNGALLASASSDRTVKLWDLSGETPVERCVLTGHTGRVLCVAFSPDGRRIASAGGLGDCTVRIWDVETGKETRAPLTGHKSWVRCVAFSPDGFWLASSSDDGTVKIWDAWMEVMWNNELTVPIMLGKRI